MRHSTGEEDWASEFDGGGAAPLALSSFHSGASIDVGGGGNTSSRSVSNRSSSNAKPPTLVGIFVEDVDDWGDDFELHDKPGTTQLLSGIPSRPISSSFSPSEAAMADRGTEILIHALKGTKGMGHDRGKSLGVGNSADGSLSTDRGGDDIARKSSKDASIKRSVSSPPAPSPLILTTSPNSATSSSSASPTSPRMIDRVNKAKIDSLISKFGGSKQKHHKLKKLVESAASDKMQTGREVREEGPGSGSGPSLSPGSIAVAPVAPPPTSTSIDTPDPDGQWDRDFHGDDDRKVMSITTNAITRNVLATPISEDDEDWNVEFSKAEVESSLQIPTLTRNNSSPKKEEATMMSTVEEDWDTEFGFSEMSTRTISVSSPRSSSARDDHSSFAAQLAGFRKLVQEGYKGTGEDLGDSNSSSGMPAAYKVFKLLKASNVTIKRYPKPCMLYTVKTIDAQRLQGEASALENWLLEIVPATRRSTRSVGGPDQVVNPLLDVSGFKKGSVEWSKSLMQGVWTFYKHGQFDHAWKALLGFFDSLRSTATPSPSSSNKTPPAKRRLPKNFSQLLKITLEMLTLAVDVWDSLPVVKSVRGKVDRRADYVRMLFSALSVFPEAKLCIALMETDVVAHRCGEVDEEGDPLSWPWLILPPSVGKKQNLTLSIAAQYVSIYRQLGGPSTPLGSTSYKPFVAVAPVANRKAITLLGLRNRSSTRAVTIDTAEDDNASAFPFPDNSPKNSDLVGSGALPSKVRHPSHDSQSLPLIEGSVPYLQVQALSGLHLFLGGLSPITGERPPDGPVPLATHDDDFGEEWWEQEIEVNEYRIQLLDEAYRQLEMCTVKARGAFALGTYHAHETANLEVAERLLFEGVYILSKVQGLLSSRLPLVTPLGSNLMLAFGDILLSNTKYTYGILALEAAVSLLGRIHHSNHSNDQKLLRKICRVCTDAKDNARSLKYYSKLLELVKEQRNINEFVYISGLISTFCLEEGNFKAACTYLESACTFILHTTEARSALYAGAFAKDATLNANQNSLKGNPSQRSFAYNRVTKATLHSEESGLGIPAGEVYQSLYMSLQLKLARTLEKGNRVNDAISILTKLVHLKLPPPLKIELYGDLARYYMKVRDLKKCISTLDVCEASTKVTAKKGKSSRDDGALTPSDPSASANKVRVGTSGSSSSYHYQYQAKAYLECGLVCDALNIVDSELSKCDTSSLTVLGALYYLRGKILQRASSAEGSSKMCQQLIGASGTLKRKSHISEAAVAAYSKAFEYCKAVEDLLRQAKTMSAISEVYLQMVFPAVALGGKSIKDASHGKGQQILLQVSEPLFEALNLASEQFNIDLMASLLTSAAELRFLQGNIAASVEYWEEAHTLIQQVFLQSQVPPSIVTQYPGTCYLGIAAPPSMIWRVKFHVFRLVRLLSVLPPPLMKSYHYLLASLQWLEAECFRFSGSTDHEPMLFDHTGSTLSSLDLTRTFKGDRHSSFSRTIASMEETYKSTYESQANEPRGLLSRLFLNSKKPSKDGGGDPTGRSTTGGSSSLGGSLDSANKGSSPFDNLEATRIWTLFSKLKSNRKSYKLGTISYREFCSLNQSVLSAVVVKLGNRTSLNLRVSGNRDIDHIESVRLNSVTSDDGYFPLSGSDGRQYPLSYFTIYLMDGYLGYYHPGKDVRRLRKLPKSKEKEGGSHRRSLTGQMNAEHLSKQQIMREVQLLLSAPPPSGDSDTRPEEDHAAGVSYMISAIGRMNLISLLTAALGETSIVFVSSSPHRLICCSEALLRLLRPFKWQHLFIPSVPPSCGSLLEAAVIDKLPFILGIHPLGLSQLLGVHREASNSLEQIFNALSPRTTTNQAKSLASSKYAHLTIVELDEGFMVPGMATGKSSSSSSSAPLSPPVLYSTLSPPRDTGNEAVSLPARYIDLIRGRIVIDQDTYMEELGRSGGDTYSIGDATSGKGSVGVATHTVVDKSAVLKRQSAIITQSVLDIFVDLLHLYPLFTRPEGVHHVDGPFDSEGMLLVVDQDVRQFLRMILRSASFAVFLSSRSVTPSGSSSGSGSMRGGNPWDTAFESMVGAKLKESVKIWRDSAASTFEGFILCTVNEAGTDSRTSKKPPVEKKRWVSIDDSKLVYYRTSVGFSRKVRGAVLLDPTMAHVDVIADVEPPPRERGPLHPALIDDMESERHSGQSLVPSVTLHCGASGATLRFRASDPREHSRFINVLRVRLFPPYVWTKIKDFK